MSTSSIEKIEEVEEIRDAIAEEAKAEEERRQRRAGIGGWMTSLAIHTFILLLLAFVVIIRPLVLEDPPVRLATISIPPPQPQLERPLPEPTAVAEFETDVVVEAITTETASMEVDISNLVSEDMPAVSINPTARAMAIGGGSSGGGAGGSGAFAAGGNGGKGSGGFFGVGDSGDQVAGRICYIIDMSRSLKKPQIALIKDRLLNSLSDLRPRQRFEVLFYSGPVWQLGDDAGAATSLWVKGRNHHDYAPVGELPKGQWRSYPPSARTAAENYVMNELPTTSGTDWRNPFQIALSMNPQPEVIFFLTDGKVDNGEETLELIRSQSGGSEGSRPRINTIAFGLDDKDGVSSLQAMSDMTGGEHVGYTMTEIEELYQQLLREGNRL